MPQDLRTTPSHGNMTSSDKNSMAYGLTHHLSDFLDNGDGAGLPTAYRVAKDAGISTNTIYRLTADPKASISPVVLASLCGALKCQPGDLLSFDPDWVSDD